MAKSTSVNIQADVIATSDTASSTDIQPVATVKIDTVSKATDSEAISAVASINAALTTFINEYELGAYSSELVTKLFDIVSTGDMTGKYIAQIIKSINALNPPNQISDIIGRYNTKSIADSIAYIFQLANGDYEDAIFTLLDFINENKKMAGAMDDLLLNRWPSAFPSTQQANGLDFINFISSLADPATRIVTMRQLDASRAGAYIKAMFVDHSTGQCPALNRFISVLGKR